MPSEANPGEAYGDGPTGPSRAGGASAPGRTRIEGTPAPTTTPTQILRCTRDDKGEGEPVRPTPAPACYA